MDIRSAKDIELLVERALREDIGEGDVTSEALIDGATPREATIIFKEDAVVAGIDVVELVFKKIDTAIVFKHLVEDGEEIKKGASIAEVEGAAASILKAERTALNFLGRLSGIATQTREYVRAIAGSKAKILDTRKTTPLLRKLEKYAVTVGGGKNHRMGLYDMVLIKDNHIKVNAGGEDRVSVIKELVEKARRKTTLKIEIEVENLEEFQTALTAAPDVILLDNMSEADILKAVKLRGEEGAPLLEASGGITLDNISRVAATGVDYISVGALTHSVKSVDVSLEIV